jgi:HAE1 family hydrophobic/amphiphilic exporter-1
VDHNKTLGIVRLATERRVTIVMITIAILVFGFVSVSRLKLNLLPELSYPTVTIRTELPGAAPTEVENLISKPIEEAVGVIKGVRQVRSISRSGQSDVTLEFQWGTEMDYAGVDIREKLDVLSLPLEAKRPVLLRFDPSAEPIVRMGLSYKAVGTAALDEEKLKALRRYADEQLKKEFESLEGVAAVKISGGLEDEIQILVDQEKLAQLQLPLDTVVQRLRAENVNLSGGRLEEGNQQFLVRTVNEFKTVEEIGNAIVMLKDGQPVYLRDIATVRQSFKEREAITRIGSEESVELAVYKEGDANTVAVADSLSSRWDGIVKRLPNGFELKKVYDQAHFISEAVDEVVEAALIGGLLSAIVIYLFLRNFWATVVISISIPVSVIAAFNVMYFNDITLNIMSLGGIALAVGMVVDDSIVVLENIEKHLHAGASALDAAVKGTSEMGLAVIATTLTTVAVFFPLVFVKGIAGQLFKDQALTVTYTLLFSLLVSLTLIPMLVASRARRDAEFAPAAPEPQEDGAPQGPLTLAERRAAMVGKRLGALRANLGHALARTWAGLRWVGRQVRRALGFVLHWLLASGVIVARAVARAAQRASDPVVVRFQDWYARVELRYVRLLEWALGHRQKVLAAAAGAFALSLAALPLLGVELIPQLAQGEFYVQVKLPPGTPLERTDLAIRSVQQAAAGIDVIETTYSVAGTGNRLDANPVDAGENAGTLNAVMKGSASKADELRAIEALRAALADLPGVEYKFGRPELFSFKTPLEVELVGYDVDALKLAGDRVAEALTASDRYADVKSTMESGHPEVQIHFDQERAAALGLVVSDIADRVVKKVRGEVATRYTLRDRKIDVLVRNLEEQRASVEDIRKLIVNPESDRPVTLDAVADIEVRTGPSEIRRVAQERVAVVSANLRYGDLGAAVADVEGVMARTVLPNGVDFRIAGQNEEMEASFDSMIFALVLAIFLVYLVMASQFESLLHPFIILFTIPLGIVGAVMALLLTNTTISVIVFIGLIMLAGIVVKNAIILIDVINRLRADGVDVHRAILDGAHSRLRPIVMTSLCTALGLAPMALGFGAGAEIRAPMAITVIGGLTISTLLTLVVIPVVYSLIEERRADLAAELAQEGV